MLRDLSTAHAVGVLACALAASEPLLAAEDQPTHPTPLALSTDPIEIRASTAGKRPSTVEDRVEESTLQLTMPVIGQGGLISQRGVTKRVGGLLASGSLQPATVSLQLPTSLELPAPLQLPTVRLAPSSLAAPQQMSATLATSTPSPASFANPTSGTKTFSELDTSGDLNGDGVVDHTDYGDWQRSAVDRFMHLMSSP